MENGGEESPRRADDLYASHTVPMRSNSTSPRSQDAARSAGVINGVRDAEFLTQHEREIQQGHHESVVLRHSDSSDELDEDEEEEVTTRVFEVELTGGSPWATAFLECASEGDLATVTKLLDDGKVGLNDVDIDGFTALMIAAAEAQTDVAMELLRRGADVSMRTHEMRSTALHFAAKSGVASVVEAICVQDPQRIDAPNLDGDTPLVWACTEGRVDAVRVLIQHHANVNVVSHRAMSALICAVMMREDDDALADHDHSSKHSDNDNHDHSHAEDATGTDADRAEIVRLLLAKNAKLVNYQDRDGSTAMHLAASHGYIECVKALLAFGADITLRNAIGQTPVEEAEETGVPGQSDVCIAYLREIWKRLEDEAAARMMAMLEMEEAQPAASGTLAKGSAKKSKKKAKKAKQRRGSKAVAAAAFTTSASAEKATASSGEGSSDDEDDERVDRKTDEPKAEDDGKVADKMEANGVETVADKDGIALDGGVWTTVGRKHNQYLSQKAADMAAATEPQDAVGSNANAVETHAAEAYSAALVSKKVLPVTPRAKHQRPTPSSALSATPPTPASTPRPRDERKTPSATKITSVTSNRRPRPATSRAPLPSAAALYPPSSSSTMELPAPTAATASTVPQLPLGSPFSTFQRLYNTSRLYERYQRHPETAADARLRGVGSSSVSSVSALWRSTAPTAAAPSSYRFDPSFALASTPSTELLSSAIWQYNSDRNAAFTTTRHAPIAASDKALRFLVCGLCGDLVDDNLQCHNSEQLGQIRAMPCLQLYCASCVARAASNSTGSASITCTKCRHPIQPQQMQRNALAQAQASALALAARSKASQLQQLQPQQQQQRTTLDEMRYLIERTDEKVQALAIDPFYLAPGANLAALSVGQLDALEKLHHTALRQITHARVENARTSERLRMEEWLKTQRDIFQYTAHTHTTAVSSHQPQSQ